MTETIKRSTRVQKIIDEKLSKYFSEDLLSTLSDAEVDVLSEYFSNYQLRELKNATPEIIKGLVSRHVKLVERQRLTNIPVDEYDQMIDYYKSLGGEVEEVVCKKCENVIAVEIKHPEYQSTQYFHNPNLHWQGRFVIAVGNRLFGYRNRHDEMMGYRCGSFMENPDFKVAMEQHEKDVEQFKKDTKNLKEGQPAPNEPIPPRVNEFIPCGNESTMSEPELEAISDEHLKQSVVTQSDIQKVKQYINKTDYKKPVKKVKDGYLLDDKFLLRKVQ